MNNKELWTLRNKVNIPETLLRGDVFDRYDDETNSLDPGCLVRLDEYGFYLVWEPKGKDAGILDMNQVWEARPSGTVKDGRVLYELEQRGRCGLAGETLEERTVWLTYGLDLVIVNGMFLIARTAQVAREWRSAMNEFLRANKFRHACPMLCLQKHWRSICLATNDRNRIPLRNIVRTFASGKPEKMVHKCLADLGLSGDKEREDLDATLFTFEKFLRLYHKICPRTEVQELFVRLSGQKEYLTRERLLQFLNEEQRDPRLNEILFPHFDQERVQQLIAKYESDESYIAQGKMSGDGFLRFLLSDENAPVFLSWNERYQDMDQPLCHYFINSSHNTYLTGRQYGGKSSTEIYRQVLLSGCRCIELDCWDGTGENKGEPIITHGKAMCTDVFFKEVLYQIKETAFTRTDFPVILSFENHCSKSNQLKMAKYCLEIFGDMLLSKPLDEYPLEPGVPLPSPNRLRRKILIKNKRLKKEEERRQMEALSQGRLLDEEEAQEEQQPVAQPAAMPSTAAATTAQPPAAAVGDNNNAVVVEECYCNGGEPPQQQQQGTTTAVAPHSISSADQRAHPEAEEDARSGGSGGGDAAQPPAGITSVSALPSHLCCALPAKPRLCPTASSASFNATEFMPASLCSAVHRASLSHTPSRQNSSVTLAGTRTPPTMSGDECGATTSSTVELNKAPTLMSKIIKQPLGLTRKVQPALSKEEEERLFKMVSDQEEIQETYRYPGATINIHPLLSSLVNYTHPIKFSGFDVAEQNDLHFHMSSFSESTGLGLLKQSALEFVNYNKRQLSRIYPKGARVDSSNFLPQIFWNAGCQMVALNFQTPDVCMQLNQGKFEYNGQCGYLLKPDFMRRPDRTFDPFSESPVDGVIAAHCSVRIISGQFLCERKTGTYVEVEMYGLPTDTIRKEHRTKLVPANGLNPIYNEEPFVFRKVILPELAVLRFAVYDENGKQLGQRILPLDGLQSGYRHISLRTEHNQASTLPTLFVHLQLKTYVPDELSGLVDALADPRAYLSAQEKREEALQQMCVDELDIVDDVVPSSNQSQPQQQQLGVGARRDRIGGAGADGVPFDSNNSIRRLQNGSTRDHQQQQQQMNSVQTTGTIIDGRANNAQSPMSGPRDASQSLRVQSDAHTTDSNKFQQVEWINVADLRREKPFLKLQKRHAKEWEEIKRRHQKMRESVQKQQQCVVERLVDQSHKMSLKKRNHLNSTSLGEKQASNDGDNKDNNCQQNQQQHNSLALRISDPAHTVTMVELTGDQKRMRSLVQIQTDEWSQLLRRLEQEEFEQHKEQIQEENALLKRLLAERQRQQIITVRAKFDAEKKELNQAQAKKSMEDSRAIQQDKSVKTKAERDRRIKELNEKNVKLFTEERRRLATKCGRHEEQLIKRHSEQSHQLEMEAAKAIELEEMSHRESLLASQPQCIV